MKRTLLRGLVLAPAALALTACGSEESTVHVQQPTATQRPTAQRSNTGQDVSQSILVQGDARIEEAEARHLLPADATFYLEISSFDDLHGLVSETMSTLALDNSDTPDLNQVLAMLAMFGVNPSQVLRHQPIGIAASLPDPEGEWAPTFILPVRDPSNFAKSLSNNGSLGTITQQGAYVAVPLHMGYRTDLDHALEFTDGMSPGLISCRFAAGNFLEQFEAMNPMDLSAMRAQATTSNPTAEALLTGWVNGIEQVMMAIKDVEFVIAEADDFMEIEFKIHIDETSELASLGSGTGHDLRELSRYVSQDDQLAMLVCCDQALVDGPFSGAFEALADWIGADDMASIIPSSGISAAFIAHVEPGETDFALIGRGMTAQPIEDMVKQGLSNMGDGRAEVIPSTPFEAKQDGKRFLQTDLLPLGSDNPEFASDILASLFGEPRMRMRMLSQGDQWMLSVGEGMSLRRKMKPSTSIPADLDHALDKVDGAATACVYRVDYKWLPPDTFQILDAHSSDMAAGIQNVMDGAGRESAWATVWCGIHGNEWNFGTSFELNVLMAQLAEQQPQVMRSIGMPR
jgi:hypothetical protein